MRYKLIHFTFLILSDYEEIIEDTGKKTGKKVVKKKRPVKKVAVSNIHV